MRNQEKLQGKGARTRKKTQKNKRLKKKKYHKKKKIDFERGGKRRRYSEYDYQVTITLKRKGKPTKKARKKTVLNTDRINIFA